MQKKHYLPPHVEAFTLYPEQMLALSNPGANDDPSVHNVLGGEDQYSRQREQPTSIWDTPTE